MIHSKIVTWSVLNGPSLSELIRVTKFLGLPVTKFL